MKRLASMLLAAWLGLLLVVGTPLQVAAAPAVGSLQERADAGQAQAQVDLAISLLCARPPQAQAAAQWLERAADQGHPGAQSVLGWMFMAGHGVKQDDVLAARWLQPAAKAGQTAAQNNLGVLYALGQGVERDVSLARQWFSAAAAQGASEAEGNLRTLDDGGSLAPARAEAASARFLSTACARRGAPPRA
jgi:uncharacterized protein